MPDPVIPAPGHVFTGDRHGALPLVIASPHSGRDYPPEFLARTRLTLAQLRRAEDPYVDTLLDGAAALGVPRLSARFGRSWLDLNRAPDELDPAMYVEPLDAHADQASDRVVAGLGVVPRIAAQGLDIYPTRLRVDDARARIASVHAPWHATLERLTMAARDVHGYAILLDCHSMPTPPPVAGGAPQIVIGDLHGRSAASALVALIEAHFLGCGLRVARNVPYAGGYTTAHHGRPEHGIHAVQIEIDRALYMDPQRLTRHMGFAAVAGHLQGLVAHLLAAAPSLGLGPRFAEAAE
ncbi:N-formylglutamate amidohydrolase [Glacieibacterium frigidum]|uniref:N-formylglutamate amidohydrolase n=1 Tax=Glacieibacterium frigidum TaxID=2593303 RepID=A0A552UHW1_9SPHN|nr:N-formylglutamate amidohydrolase [Glacieibacterium frigidum]TRW17809.1 N-formylglutamate amidohydrolase [Glacieibacterium frigidum]